MKRWSIITSIATLLFHVSLAAAQPEGDVRVRAFVRNHTRGEMPLLEARGLGEGALATLYEILLAPGEKSRWTAAIQTVAFIGSEESYPFVHDFIWKRFSGAIDDTTLHAVLIAVSVLGVIPEGKCPGIARQIALATEPTYWRSLPWTCRMPNAARDRALAAFAASSLQWTGSSTADSVFDAMSRKKNPLLDENSIAELVARNAHVRALTLEGYARARADSLKAFGRTK